MNRYLIINGSKLYEVVSSLWVKTQEDLMLALLIYSASNGEEPNEHRHDDAFNNAWEKVKECVSWGEVIKETAKDRVLREFKERYKQRNSSSLSGSGEIENELLSIYNSLTEEQKQRILNSIKK